MTKFSYGAMGALLALLLLVGTQADREDAKWQFGAS